MRISVPNLTIKEFRYLESQLPSNGKVLQLGYSPPGRRRRSKRCIAIFRILRSLKAEIVHLINPEPCPAAYHFRPTPSRCRGCPVATPPLSSETYG